MKIGFIEPHLKIYGGIRRIIEISNRLVKRGHEVTIYHSTGLPCEWMVSYAKTKCAEDVLKEKNDVLFFNDPTKHDFNIIRKADAKVKVYFILELYKTKLLKGHKLSVFFPWNRRTYYVRKALSQNFLLCSNATWEKKFLEEELNLPCKLLLGGLNKDIFYPINRQKKEGNARILYSGDPRFRKGGKIIKKALNLVREKYPEIISTTYYNKGIPQSQMAQVYSSADVFIEASTHAGWNNPVFEAMACKTPVACTDIGGVKDFAVHEKTALLSPINDHRELANSVIRLLQDKQLAKNLAEEAYKTVQMFSWDDSIDKLEKLLIDELQRENG